MSSTHLTWRGCAYMSSLNMQLLREPQPWYLKWFRCWSSTSCWAECYEHSWNDFAAGSLWSSTLSSWSDFCVLCCNMTVLYPSCPALPVGYLSSSALSRSWDIAATYQACTQILTSYSLTATLSASSWKVPGLVHHPGLLCWLDQFPIELFQASCQQNQTHKLTCHLNWNVTVWWMRFGINSVLSSISEFSIYKLKSTQFILKFQSR